MKQNLKPKQKITLFYVTFIKCHRNLQLSKMRNVGCVRFCDQFELELASSSYQL